jgi:hypothetical protein
VLGAAHLSGVLVYGRGTFPPASDLGGAVVGLAFVGDHRLVGEKRDDGVNVTMSIVLEAASDAGSLKD